jgi:hypothetical protein
MHGANVSRPTLVAAVVALAGCSEIAAPSNPVIAPIEFDVVQSAQVIYSYRGNTFNLFSCGGDVLCPNPDPQFTSYTTSDYVSAVLTLSQPLPGGLNLQNVRNLPGFSLTMTDGHQVMTLDPGVPGEALVSTDANGNIVAPWSVFVNCCSFPNNNVFALNWPGVRGIGDGGGLTVPTGLFPNTPRDQGMIFGSPGVWTTRIPTPEELVASLVTGVQALIGVELNTGQANGLTRPLANAMRSISQGQIAAACSQLVDFIAEVNAKTPPLGAASAAALIADAVAIQVALGC